MTPSVSDDEDGKDGGEQADQRERSDPGGLLGPLAFEPENIPSAPASAIRTTVSSSGASATCSATSFTLIVHRDRI